MSRRFLLEPSRRRGRPRQLPDRLRARVTGLRRQLSLLGTAPGFRLLFLATLGSSLRTLLATVALVVDVKDRTDSGPWVSALMILEFLPPVVVGLFLAPLLDRS